MPNILVVGSMNMDVVLRLDHVPQGGECCFCDERKHVSGGKGANQAIAAARLNCPTSFYCKVGDDDFGKTLYASLQQDGVNVDFIKTVAGVPSGVAYILLEKNGQNRIICDGGAYMRYSVEERAMLEKAIEQHDIVLMQLEIPMELIVDTITIARQKNKKIIVDAGPARKCDLSIFNGVEILSPNETETEGLTGMKVQTLEDRLKAAQVFLNHGVKSVVLKLGGQGALYVDKQQHKHFPPYKTTVVDTTAAGDSFTAALAAAMHQGQDIFHAIDFANKAGALAVSKLGAQPSLPTLAEIESHRWELVK